MAVAIRDLNCTICKTQLFKVEFSFIHVKQIELNLIL